MGWSTTVIYTLPNEEIIDYFRDIDSLKNRVFKVADLDGIRSEWTRDLFESNKKQKHTLPIDGLLVIAPSIYRTGYDKEPNETFFTNNTRDVNKFSNLPYVTFPYCLSDNIRQQIILTEDEASLVKTMVFLSRKTNIPLVYYRCEMWGGMVEIEYAIVADNDQLSVYVFNEDTNKTENLLEQIEIDSSSLQAGLSHLGLDLPSSFFALHESSFDWQPYQV